MFQITETSLWFHFPSLWSRPRGDDGDAGFRRQPVVMATGRINQSRAPVPVLLHGWLQCAIWLPGQLYLYKWPSRHSHVCVLKYLLPQTTNGVFICNEIKMLSSKHDYDSMCQIPKSTNLVIWKVPDRSSLVLHWLRLFQILGSKFESTKIKSYIFGMK